MMMMMMMMIPMSKEEKLRWEGFVEKVCFEAGVKE